MQNYVPVSIGYGEKEHIFSSFLTVEWPKFRMGEQLMYTGSRRQPIEIGESLALPMHLAPFYNQVSRPAEPPAIEL